MKSEMTMVMDHTTTQSFNTYFKLYHQEMLHFAAYITKDYHLAEDVIQEAFIKAYRHQANIKDASKWKAWLKTIVRRTAIDILRKEQRYPMISLDIVQDFQLMMNEHHIFVEKAIEMKGRYSQIKSAIEQLSPALSDVLLLKISYDITDRDLAKYFSISVSAVKTRLYRARQQLKNIISQQSNESIQEWLSTP